MSFLYQKHYIILNLFVQFIRTSLFKCNSLFVENDKKYVETVEKADIHIQYLRKYFKICYQEVEST